MTSRTPADRTAAALTAALTAALISPNESDSYMEPANVVDGLFAIARAVHHLADAVTGESAKADKRSEIVTNAIRSISHGGMSGPTGLEMLSMAINGEGAPGRNPVSDAIREGLGEIAEAVAIASVVEGSTR